MKKTLTLATILSLLSILFAIESFAQKGMPLKGSRGWGMGAPYGRMYDAKTVETISGEVVSVDKIIPSKGMSYGIHLTVKTEKETISVHLGPSWYLENQDVKIEPKDKIDVKGSRISFRGKPAIIAAEVKKRDETLKLRDENGFPVWSGWRKK